MRQSSSRTGNALVLAVGAMAIVATVMIATTDNAVKAVRDSRQDLDQQRIVSAVGATLVRREKLINQAASLGAEGFVRRFDPAYDHDFGTVGFVGQDNYGIDWIGDVQIAWKIEPTRTREGGQWRQNPRPDGEEAVLEMPNTFLFKISAEGRINQPDGRARARVQGVRYTAINKEPLFRYIIFYSQENPKGDIEMGHGPDFAARGSVHTNAALYLGGGPRVNDWVALNSGVMGSTLLGPDAANKPVMVNAYDGIFRLSKHTVFSAANGLTGIMAGAAPAGFNATAWYETSTATPMPGEYGPSAHFRVPPAGGLSAATFGGTEVNPHRVRDGYGLVTTETTDTRRTINGIPVRGVAQASAKANDSRDRHRTGGSTLVWAVDSLRPGPDGFDKKARTSDNGGRMVRLPAIMANRPLEAQRIRYEDVDGDPTTDNHEYARPLFIVNGAETAVHPAATGPVVESPGNYIGHALGGGDLAMTRVQRTGSVASQNISTGYNAWQVTTKAGDSAIAEPPTMGLIVRERMQPDLGYLSGSSASSAGPDYIPYSYGKHLRTSRWPLWPIDVAAGTGSGEDAASNLGGTIRHAFTTTDSNAHINSTLATQTYVEGGLLSAAAAAEESYAAWTDTSSGYQRVPRFYRSNWRLFHLQRPSVNADATGTPLATGLTATFFDDYSAAQSWRENGGWLGAFGGAPVRVQIDANGIDENDTTYASQLTGTSIPGRAGGDFFSVRYTGFIRPQYSEAYTFFHTTDDGGRLWVNGVRLADQWADQGPVVNGGGQASSILLEAGQWYPIVVEMYERNGGCQNRLEWQSPSQARQVVPASRLAPAKQAGGGAFPRAQLASVQVKVTPGSGPTTQKLGLMLMPVAVRAAGSTAVGGIPALAQGQDPYLALVYTPQRGIHAEFRGQRASSARQTPPRHFVGYAQANPSTGVQQTDLRGEVGVDPGTLTRLATITPSQTVIDADSGVVEQGRSTNQSTSSPTSPATANGVSVAEGAYDNVRSGAWSRRISQNPTIDVVRRRSTTWRFALGGTWPASAATQVFSTSNPADNIPGGLTVYAAGTGTTTLAVPGGAALGGLTTTSFNLTWTTSTDPAAQAWGNVSGFSNGTTTVSVTVGTTTFSGVAQATTVSGNTVTREYTLGSANTYWYIDSNPPRYQGTSTAVPFANFQSNIAARFPGAQVVRISSGSNPPAPSLSVPYQSGLPTVALPTLPTGWTHGTTPRTFAVNRTTPVTFDLHSWISRVGGWFATNRAQVLPWPTSTIWNGITAPPVTGSFRPDLWTYRRTGVATPQPADHPRRTGIDSQTITDAAMTQVGTPRWTHDLPAAWPPAGGAPAAVWLRIERSAADVVTLRYALTAGTPGPADWATVTHGDGSPLTWSLAGWAADLLIGPCIQSGSRTTAASAVFSDLAVDFTTAQAAGEVAATTVPTTRLDAADWEAQDAQGVTDYDKYLAGQYQVFFGPYEITEHFFRWRDPASGVRLAEETWLANPREFWSQSRWWNSGTEKDRDASPVLPTTLTPSVRELIARTTVLTLNMGALQTYLKSASMGVAVGDLIAGAGPAAPTLPAPADLLASRFNGVFYTARTNRYPWNPNLAGANPWNVALPNGTTGSTGNDALLALAPAARATAFAALAGAMATANQTALHSTANAALRQALQPYAALVGNEAPAFKPTQWPHAVRVINGASMHWGFPGGGSVPEFGTGKTAVVTPNPIYVQGQFNTTKQTVRRNGANSAEWVPMAVMADQITILSSAWVDADARVAGLSADANGLTTTAITARTSLSRGWDASHPLPSAVDTSVVAAFVTHNQPTTRASVINGEAASIISVVQFLENWAGRTFDYTGSLVVMDSRRCTEGFQLEDSKTMGPSPFGYLGATWRSTVSGVLGDPAIAVPANAWIGTTARIPPVYVPPTRVFTFNPDFLTPQGTPPFAPFGTSARGVGGWIHIIQ